MSSDPTIDILCLAAHPDDAELHVGGTLIKMREAGHSIGILDFSRGEAATHGTVADRERETAAANAIIRPDLRLNLGLPDSGLADDLATRKLVVDIIRRHRVGLLIAPWAPCRHPDHQAVHDVARSAHFFSGAGGFPSDYPPHRPKRLMFHLEEHDARPSFVVDISAQFDARMQAVSCYATQFYTPGGAAKTTDVGSRRFDHKMRARFAHYGGIVGVDYGEAFIIDAPPRIDDPLTNALQG